MDYIFMLLAVEDACVFKYESWKMVFQRVIRSTFDEIIYTYEVGGIEAASKARAGSKEAGSRHYKRTHQLLL